MNSMFGISWKTNILKSDLLLGMTDLHAHLLPGVDDGIQTWNEAQRAVDWLYALGTRRVYLTPHVMEELGNTAASLRERFDEWQARISGPMHFRLAAEYMLDNGFARQRKEGLLTLDERHLLAALVRREAETALRALSATPDGVIAFRGPRIDDLGFLAPAFGTAHLTSS